MAYKNFMNLLWAKKVFLPTSLIFLTASSFNQGPVAIEKDSRAFTWAYQAVVFGYNLTNVAK